MHWSLVPAWLCVLGVSSAQNVELAPEVATLVRIKSRMSETLARQPNYTCVQQVERSHRRVPRGRYELHDLLRVEVALVDGKEMFAWPGARRFEETDLTEMISGGAIGTGNFATHARAVFQTSAPRFKAVGAEQVSGRRALRYDFVVPFITSGYHIRVDKREAVVGYHGSFWADPDTAELMRLEINADDIPPSLGIATAQDRMDYGRVKIGTSEFLLPVASELVMVDLLGNESRNRTQFTSCRQYTGESVLTFADPTPEQVAEPPAAAPGQKQTAAKQSIEIPADLSFDVKLQTEIDSAKAAVGDPVVATLDDSIKLKRQILAPKGATLLGRILRLERRGDYAVLDFQFSEIDSEKVHGTLFATVEKNIRLLGSLAFQSYMSVYERRPRLQDSNGIQIHGGRFRLRPGERVRLRTQAVSH